MNSPIAAVDSRARRHPTAAFVLAAYALSWTVATPLIAGVVPSRMHLAVALGPAVAAVWVIWVLTGRQGLASLWSRLHDVRRVRSARWWLLAASPLAFLAIGLTVAGIAGDLPGDTQWNSGFDGQGWVVGLLGASVAFGVFEEIGWRGFLLPQLQVGRTASSATFLLWLIWAGWHAPMWLYHFDFEPFLAVGWLVGLYFGAVMLTCLHNSTNGSLAVVIVFHVSFNLASISAAEISDAATAIVSALVIVTTIITARRGGPTDLSRSGRFSFDPAEPSRQHDRAGAAAAEPLNS